MNEKYLKVENLKDGYLYKINARNAKYGIWDKDKGGFTISRFKFKENFLCMEIHWDLDKNFGTAKPIEEIEKCYVKDKSEILKYLNKFEKLRCNLCGRYRTDWVVHDPDCPNRLKI